jgi:hypothetical protein
MGSAGSSSLMLAGAFRVARAQARWIISALLARS